MCVIDVLLLGSVSIRVFGDVLKGKQTLVSN